MASVRKLKYLSLPARNLVFPGRYLAQANAGFRFYSDVPPSYPSQAPPAWFGRQTLPRNLVVIFAPQQEAWVIERMGKFNRILQPGLNLLWPIIERIAYVKSLKEIAMEIPSQSAITLDNVTLNLNGVLYIKIVDAYNAAYGVEDAEYAVSQLAQTTMRSEIGQMTLDAVLKERHKLNSNITVAINDAARNWGVECLRYEIRDIHPPSSVLQAMQRQVSAERSKRAEILESEGQRQSAINIAEGDQQSVILRSDAARAERINLAIGEAEAITRKADATAQGLAVIANAIESNPRGLDAVALNVAEKYVGAFGQLAKEGNSVIVPAKLGDMGGMIAEALAIFKNVSASPQSRETARRDEHVEKEPKEEKSEEKKRSEKVKEELAENSTVEKSPRGWAGFE